MNIATFSANGSGRFDGQTLLWLDMGYSQLCRNFRPHPFSQLSSEGLSIMATGSSRYASVSLDRGNIQYLVSAAIRVDDDLPILKKESWYSPGMETAYGLDFITLAGEKYPELKIGVMSLVGNKEDIHVSKTIQYAKENLKVDFWLRKDESLSQSKVYQTIDKAWGQR